jgi:hypothetical protein
LEEKDLQEARKIEEEDKRLFEEAEKERKIRLKEATAKDEELAI